MPISVIITKIPYILFMLNTGYGPNFIIEELTQDSNL